MNPFIKAFEMIFSGNPEIYLIVFTSLRFSVTTALFSSAISIPLGVTLWVHTFPAKKTIIAILNTLMALPTVVVGLLVYSLLSRSGPLGFLSLLFTPGAVIIGQTFLAFPIITSMVFVGLNKLDFQLHETLITLGSSKLDIFRMTLKEARFIILSAVLAGFGRVIGEVGVSMMLGGNIRWYTRTITTAIALETSKGEIELGLALGIILLIIAFVVNFSLHRLVRYEN
ncbi:MAG: ABC transporter permease [Spirochaetota bacterium]